MLTLLVNAHRPQMKRCCLGSHTTEKEALSNATWLRLALRWTQDPHLHQQGAGLLFNMANQSSEVARGNGTKLRRPPVSDMPFLGRNVHRGMWLHSVGCFTSSSRSQSHLITPAGYVGMQVTAWICTHHTFACSFAFLQVEVTQLLARAASDMASG